MSDDNKANAVREHKEQVNDCPATHQVDMAAKGETVEIVKSNDEAIEEHIRELLDILIDPFVPVASGTKKQQGLQEKKERSRVLRKKRQRKHDEVMAYEKLQVYKQRFDDMLKKKKVSDDDRKSKTYNELCKMVMSPKSLYEERAKFYQEQMQFKESPDEFFKRLTDQSNFCQFGERQSAVVADVFILSHSNVYYGFCTEGQKEVRGKKALKMAKQFHDKDIFR